MQASTFTLYTKGRITEVSAIFVNRDEELQDLIEFTLKRSAIAFISDISYSESSEVSFVVAAKNGILDLRRVCDRLCRFEQGWEVKDEVLYSPKGSGLKLAQIKELLEQG